MTERIQKEILVHIPMTDFSDELESQARNIKSLVPLATWFDKSGDLVVEFEAVVDD